MIIPFPNEALVQKRLREIAEIPEDEMTPALYAEMNFLQEQRKDA